MTCKDCIHSELCKEMHRFGVVDLSYDKEGAPCELFKSKADFVLHGVWEKFCDDCCECSLCGTVFVPQMSKMPYCPKCGAKMDGKGEHSLLYADLDEIIDATN